jgi:hypothetical protein
LGIIDDGIKTGKGEMKALSFKQPWAWLIFNGKDIDNRNWRTNFRGRIYVHASKTWDAEGFKWILGNKEKLNYTKWLDMMMIENAKDEMAFGALVGEVDIIDCVSESSSPWFFGKYGFVLANPISYSIPIPYKGMLNLFEVNLYPLQQPRYFTPKI